MELQAVIAALNALKRPCRVTLHTDSEYVQRGVTEWMPRWKAKGWRKVANRDLWEALDRAAQRHTIDWQWVKGHAGDPLNERVDWLAVSMIPRTQLPLDDAGAAHLFTGVSCHSQTGPGGWAVLARTGESTLELSGHEAKTSANRLHLVAIAKGLERAPVGARVHVYTSSDYAAQGASQWLKQWAARGWRTKEGQPIKHLDLWQAIDEAAHSRQVYWHSLKGEMRPAESRRAEELAGQAAH
jgi:ribonuclease HI